MSDIILPAEVRDELKKISRVAGYLWQREWAERNAGNISMNLTSYFNSEDVLENVRHKTFTLFNFPKGAAGLVLFITGTGCYLRSLIDHIDEAACIIYINDEATGYTLIWGGKSPNFGPTSELISHSSIHVFNAENNPKHLAIVHTHPPELIVMSHHPLFAHEEELNRQIWMMCPEVRVFVPKGIHCTPYALSSTAALAKATIEAFKIRNVSLWEKHGATATGEDVEKAWDYLDVANKGAKLLQMCWAAGFEPAGLSNEQLTELEQFT
ncbi:rhamnulose-1-phosphate aldolase [Pedobacter endophyticus]|uniref:Rhamnulose-1-phosphate aldolase n=1 Tax=Pedobacter endophyticus TaxID=2789740 RepID=A0A7U3Q4Q0_9SPHI|nr:rhamnulose-1-phosphate aldolase [Pedobacter endophyticus]QPH38548.1 rhamnulose-1-phosphate aldolase [Pedobacter endophyticus]